MSALGFVAGGLLQGTGEGILAEAKAQRDYMLKGIDQEFQQGQQERQFGQQTKEREGAEAFQEGQQGRALEHQSEESEKGRELTRSEGKLTREQQTAIQKQNETFLAGLPSNNPETVDDATGLKYTRNANGLLPMTGPDGQQMSQLRLRVSDKGRLAAVDEQAREGETLSAPLPYAAAVEQSRGILGDVRTDKLIAGRQAATETTVGGRTTVAETNKAGKLGSAEIKAQADLLKSAADVNMKWAIANLNSDDKAKALTAQQMLADKKIDADVALEAQKSMSAQELQGMRGKTAREIAAGHDATSRANAETAAGSREPGAAQRIKGNQAEMEAVNSQAQRLARSAGDQVYKAGGTFQGEGTIFKDFGGRKQFESDFADEMAEDLVKKKAGEIKMTRTTDQIITDLRAARGGAAAEGGAGAAPAAGKPAPAAPAKPAKGAGGAGKSQDNPATPQSKEDLDALESGDYYTNPSDGALYQKK